MSDQLAAAAAALGLPEALVERSAEARAAEIGATTEEVIAGWAGGEAPPPVPETTTTEVAPQAPEPISEPAVAPPAVVETAPIAEAVPAAVSAGPYVPPVLVGAEDKPSTVLAGVIAVFLMVLLVGLVGPSLADENPGARTSENPYSATAIDGRAVYQTLGCASCHTQMVRPVVADVGLGPVTLNDTNQVLGTRRFGPDLSAIGSRMTASQIESTVNGLDGHPSHSLSEDDLGALVAYLSESNGGDS